jgi:hypothetical protein
MQIYRLTNFLKRKSSEKFATVDVRLGCLAIRLSPFASREPFARQRFIGQQGVGLCVIARSEMQCLRSSGSALHRGRYQRHQALQPPPTGTVPFSLKSVEAEIQHICGLGTSHSQEEPQFNDGSTLRRLFAQLFNQFIHGDNQRCDCSGHNLGVPERNEVDIGTGPRAIDQVTAHNACRKCKEMSAVMPVDILRGRQEKVLVHQSSRLKSVYISFAAKISCRKNPQFWQDQLKQARFRIAVAIPPAMQQLGKRLTRCSVATIECSSAKYLQAELAVFFPMHAF